MKHQFLAAITGGLCLTMPIATPPAQADSLNLTFTFPALQGIDLTPTQEEKLKALSSQTLAEVKGVLTPEQSEKFDRSMAKGIGLKKSLMSLNLSLSQQWKLRNQLAPKKQQVEAILTPAQQQQARQNIDAIR